MNPYQEEIYAVKPGSVVLMYGSKLVGLIIGVYKLKDSEYDEYHIMWAYEDGEIGLTITQNPECWIEYEIHA